MALDKSPIIPFYQPLVDGTGFLSKTWQAFYRNLKDLLDALGLEKSSEIVNFQATLADVTGLALSSKSVSFGVVEYLIQRVTTGTNPVEYIQAGTFYLVYKPTSQAWVMVTLGTPGPTISPGVTLTVTNAGQVQYTSTLVDGTPSISKITFRVRTLSAKNKVYSEAGS